MPNLDSEELRDELLSLLDKQLEVLESSAYVTLTDEEQREYEARKHRIHLPPSPPFVRYQTKISLEIYNIGVNIFSQQGRPIILGRAAMLDTNWQKLYEAAMLELNPDKLVTLIEAAERAIVEQELRPDVTQLERRKLADARSMLKSLNRITSQGKQAASESQPRQQEQLG
jgi:hypothetical protein